MNDKALTEMVTEARRDYAPEYATGRHLFRVWSDKKIVAFITAYEADNVIKKYQANGGGFIVTRVEQISHGYPNDLTNILA